MKSLSSPMLMHGAFQPGQQANLASHGLLKNSPSHPAATTSHRAVMTRSPSVTFALPAAVEQV